MKMRLLGTLTASAVALTLAATAASAAIVNITYQGTVTSSYDGGGLFGVAHTSDQNSYAGMSYTAVYVLNTSLGQPYTEPGYKEIYGWPPNGPMVEAKVTVNGHTFTLPSQQGGSAWIHDSGIGTYQVGHSAWTENGIWLDGTFKIAVNEYEFSLQAPLQYDLTNSGEQSVFNYGGKAVKKAKKKNTTKEDEELPPLPIILADERAFISAQLLSVTIENIAGVPEPSTWLMMLAGFVTIGGMVRHRQSLKSKALAS
jgi:hypothetical protein